MDLGGRRRKLWRRANTSRRHRSRRRGATHAQSPGQPGIRRGPRFGAEIHGAELGALICGAELGAIYTPFFPSSRASIICFPLSRFLSEPPLAQTTNLTLESPIKTTDLQEQGILYALLIFDA